MNSLTGIAETIDVEVDVTAEDIENGGSTWATCPVAHAFRRTCESLGMRDQIMSNERLSYDVYDVYLVASAKGGRYREWASRLPDNIARWVVNYDSGDDPTLPIKFPLTLERAW